MSIIITQWALDAYLQLKDTVFTRKEFETIIKPDVYRLKRYLLDAKFENGKFWSPVGHNIKQGFKMKWHQIGNGKVQLRLLIALFDRDFYLCQAYAKRNEKYELRQLMKFKVYIQLIKEGNYKHCGVLK